MKERERERERERGRERQTQTKTDGEREIAKPREIKVKNGQRQTISQKKIK